MKILFLDFDGVITTHKTRYKLDLEKKIKYWDPNAKLWVELRTLKWTHDWTYGENEK